MSRSKTNNTGLIDRLVCTLDKVLAKLFWTLQSITQFRWTGSDYGWKEALFYPTNVDTWTNYSSVLDKLLELVPSGGQASILDVGAGGLGFTGLVEACKQAPGLKVTSLDVSLERVFGAGTRRVVLADARHLPVKEDSFDFVVCIDSEAILDERAICEMKRTARRNVILHFPVDSENGCFAGSKGDREFQERHIHTFGRVNEWTASVLEVGHPTLGWLQELMPGMVASGTDNVDVWLKHMVNARRPVIRFFTGIWYIVALKQHDFEAPHRGCLAVYSKRCDQYSECNQESIEKQQYQF